MELIRANQSVYENLNAFLLKNETIDARSLANSGYVIQVDSEIIGCFVLELTETNDSWLKQLYITQDHAAKLPILLEAISNLARQQNSKHIHIHSHQPVVDLLLEALQFYPQQDTNLQLELEEQYTKGNWWTAEV